MRSYRFQFSAVASSAVETVTFDHSSDDDAMCDAARTVAEMLRDQTQAGPDLNSFSLNVFGPEGRAVGVIEVTITRPSTSL